MVATESIDRNLATEDAAYANELLGAGNTPDPGDDMRIMAARDVIVQQPAKSGPSMPPPIPSVPPRGLLAKAAPLLLAGALGASGVGIPWALGMLGGAAAETVVDTDTRYLLELVGD